MCVQQSIEQAAEQLGKTHHQIRYLIKTKRIQASKVGGRWRVDGDSLPQSPGQAKAKERKQTQLRAAVDRTLDLPAGKRYSLRDLKAFEIAAQIYHQCVEALGAEHPSTEALLCVLDNLALGCHRFRNRDSLRRYRPRRPVDLARWVGSASGFRTCLSMSENWL